MKRALNAAGYAFVDVSVSGTNVGNFMAGYGKDGLRAALLGYGSAVITDHLHNDRKSGTAFEAAGGWTEAIPAAWNNTGLRVRYGWHNAWLRSKLKPGARVVRCTLAPATNSSDGWATVAGQTGKNDDATWAADYATGSSGDQFKLNDLIMRARRVRPGLAYGGPAECEGGGRRAAPATAHLRARCSAAPGAAGAAGFSARRSERSLGAAASAASEAEHRCGLRRGASSPPARTSRR